MNIKTLLGAVALALALGGCASGVKLDEVPVEDRKATSAGAQSSGVSDAAATGGVAPVVLAESKGSGIGPAGTPHTVLFDYDSFVIRADARPVIEAHARFLQANAQRTVVLEGHTDERGGREYNLALGQKRAEAVRRALSLLGVADSRLEAVSFGKEKPAASGQDEAAHARNRRVEIRY